MRPGELSLGLVPGCRTEAGHSWTEAFAAFAVISNCSSDDLAVRDVLDGIFFFFFSRRSYWLVKYRHNMCPIMARNCKDLPGARPGCSSVTAQSQLTANPRSGIVPQSRTHSHHITLDLTHQARRLQAQGGSRCLAFIFHLPACPPPPNNKKEGHKCGQHPTSQGSNSARLAHLKPSQSTAPARSSCIELRCGCVEQSLRSSATIFYQRGQRHFLVYQRSHVNHIVGAVGATVLRASGL